jgi:phosphatidylinositol N-acetylglucosaminyltransferase subunit C
MLTFDAVLKNLQAVPVVFPSLTMLSSSISVALTAALSPTVASLYAAVYVFVTLIAPLLLVWAQRYKK